MKKFFTIVMTIIILTTVSGCGIGGNTKVRVRKSSKEHQEERAQRRKTETEQTQTASRHEKNRGLKISSTVEQATPPETTTPEAVPVEVAAAAPAAQVQVNPQAVEEVVATVANEPEIKLSKSGERRLRQLNKKKHNAEQKNQATNASSPDQ